MSSTKVLSGCMSHTKSPIIFTIKLIFQLSLLGRTMVDRGLGLIRDNY